MRLILFFCFFSVNIMATELKVLAIEYPPYTTKEINSYGLSFELLREALKHTEYNIVPVFLPPLRAERDLLKFPVTLYSNFELNIKNNFRQIEIYNINYKMFYNSKYGEVHWDNLKDLSGKTYSEIRFSSDSNKIDSLLSESGFKKIPANSLQHMFLLLQKGRVDLVLSVNLSAVYELRIKGLDFPEISYTKKNFFELTGGPWFNMTTGEGQLAYKKYLKGLERMKKDGTLYSILEKYYGEDNIPPGTIIK